MIKYVFIIITLCASCAVPKGISEGRLVHTVYFDLKEDLTEAEKDTFYQEIETLHKIPVVKGLVYGDFADLKDKRAMSEYELVMQMHFTNEKEFQEYQAHPLHLALKKTCGAFLSRPPVTHDFTSR